MPKGVPFFVGKWNADDTDKTDFKREGSKAESFKVEMLDLRFIASGMIWNDDSFGDEGNG